MGTSRSQLRTTDCADTKAAAGPEKFSAGAMLRLLLPKEHGSWSLTFEPVALGLLAAPSRPGMSFALAASAGFFLRRPLKLVLQARPDPRQRLAAYGVGGLSLLALAGLLGAIGLGSVVQLWPLLPVLAAGALFLWFDARNEGREGAAEIAGAAAFALLPAVFASLAGWRWESSLALAAVMLARSVPTVMLVRARLRRAKGRPTATRPALVATLCATILLLWLAGRAMIPWLAGAVSVLLLARAVWYLSAQPTPLTAKQIGVLELILGLAVVLTAAWPW